MLVLRNKFWWILLWSGYPNLKIFTNLLYLYRTKYDEYTHHFHAYNDVSIIDIIHVSVFFSSSEDNAMMPIKIHFEVMKSCKS